MSILQSSTFWFVYMYAQCTCFATGNIQTYFDKDFFIYLPYLEMFILTYTLQVNHCTFQIPDFDLQVCKYGCFQIARHSTTWTTFEWKTLPKAQRTRGLSSAYQSHKFLHKSWSNFIFKILTKHHLQNLNQTSPSWLNKLKLQNLF